VVLMPRVQVESNKLTRRPGLTVMELVVVLAILAAVAAILIPTFPNLLRRAHKATDCTQTGEVAKSVQLYQAAFLSYPDNFDQLTDGTTFPAYLPGGATPFGGFVIADTLTKEEVAALANAGINFVQPLASDSSPANFHPTMNPYGATYVANQKAIDDSPGSATTKKFALLADNGTLDTKNSAFLATERATDPTARFIVFGVGPRNTMVGQTVQDAPTSVPQKKDFTPDNTYSRVGVIFKISGKEVTRTERARLIAAVALEDDELESTEKDIIGYYEVSRDPRN
jgi:type II secretory pathway pseudopilin PulG